MSNEKELLQRIEALEQKVKNLQGNYVTGETLESIPTKPKTLMECKSIDEFLEVVEGIDFSIYLKIKGNINWIDKNNIEPLEIKIYAFAILLRSAYLLNKEANGGQEWVADWRDSAQYKCVISYSSNIFNDITRWAHTHQPLPLISEEVAEKHHQIFEQYYKILNDAN